MACVYAPTYSPAMRAVLVEEMITVGYSVGMGASSSGSPRRSTRSTMHGEARRHPSPPPGLQHAADQCRRMMGGCLMTGFDPEPDSFSPRHTERLELLRVFGRLPDSGVSECTEAGVRKASGEETAGGVCSGGGIGLWGFGADV
jgi:hypothetical protein